MILARSRSKGEGTLSGWLLAIAGQARERECPPPTLQFAEIQDACMRLGVPLSLFVDLERTRPDHAPRRPPQGHHLAPYYLENR